MKDEEVREWFRGLAGDRACVLHVPTGRIGQVVEYFPSGKWMMPGSVSTPCPDAVVRIDTGDHFLAKDRPSFVKLSEVEAAVLIGFSEAVREAVSGYAKRAAVSGVAFDAFFGLAEATLLAQVAVIQAHRKAASDASR